MTTTIFRRLLWKEYRLQRAYWIALFVLSLFLLLIVWAVSPNQSNHEELSKGLYYTALWFPLFYALGSASTIFAGEHDAGTYQFQRFLPVQASSVFWVKLFYVLFSSFMMFVLLLLIVICITRGNIRFADEKNLTLAETQLWIPLIISFIAIFVLGLWGVFFSLILKRPLQAVVFTVAAAIFATYVAAVFEAGISYKNKIIPLFLYPSYLICLALVDIWLGKGWFLEHKRSIVATRGRSYVRAKKSGTLAEYLARQNSRVMLQRLSWQHWRQSRWIGIVALVMLSPLILTAVITFAYYGTINPRNNSVLAGLNSCGSVLALALPPIIGSFTFLLDQRQNGFRYFVERGISARLVWFSRLLPWSIIVFFVFVLPVILVMFSLVFGLDIRGPKESLAWLGDWFSALVLIGYVAGYSVLGLAVGQFFSMIFRSGLLAGLFSVICSGLLVGWAALMHLWGIDWWWSVAPIPLALLYATWLRAPDWILERRTFNSWLRPALAIVLPMIVILTIVPLYRAYEFPDKYPSISPEINFRPLSTEEQTTLDKYKLVLEKFTEYEPPKSNNSSAEEVNEAKPNKNDPSKPEPLTADEIAWAEANKDVLPLAVEASKGADGVFTPSSLPWNESDPGYVGYRIGAVAECLTCSARKLEEEGKLDAALEQYLAALRIARQIRISGVIFRDTSVIENKVTYFLPYWGARPEQTPERIKKAIKEYEKITSGLPANSSSIKYNYLIMRDAINAAKQNNGTADLPLMPLTYIWLKMPWERERALRLLNILVENDLQKISYAEEAAKNGTAIDVNPGYDRSLRQRIYRIPESIYALRDEVILPPIDFIPERNGSEKVASFANEENLFRKTSIILAIQGWKLEHGEYPKKLDELVGSYLTALPNDPYTGEPYKYFPSGIELSMPGVRELIASPLKSKPLLWSASSEIFVKNSETDNIYHHYEIRDIDVEVFYGTYTQRSVRSEYDLYSHGRLFPVP